MADTAGQEAERIAQVGEEMAKKEVAWGAGRYPEGRHGWFSLSVADDAVDSQLPLF